MKKKKAEELQEKESLTVVIPSGEEKKDKSSEKVKTSFSTRYFMLILCTIAVIIGAGLFGIFIKTTNNAIGAPAIMLMAAGAIAFKHYWSQSTDSVNKQIGEKNRMQVNSMNIYSRKIVFEEVHNPLGFPWQCLNDKKHYYVHKWDEATNRLTEWVLPDQQYIDPAVFATRVLSLPCHRKIFRRREKLMQKLKTAMLVLGILIVWLLIITTSGS